jgi:hypothetical protein
MHNKEKDMKSLNTFNTSQIKFETRVYLTLRTYYTKSQYQLSQISIPTLSSLNTNSLKLHTLYGYIFTYNPCLTDA